MVAPPGIMEAGFGNVPCWASTVHSGPETERATHNYSITQANPRVRTKGVNRPRSHSGLLAANLKFMGHVKVIQKVGMQLSSRSWVLLGLWDRVLIPEMWDCLIISRLIEAATRLGIKDKI